MLFWFVAALLTFGASLAVLLPLSRRTVDADSPAQADIAVYRDQLREIEKDKARGLIGASDAEQARAEVGRRILRLADAPWRDSPRISKLAATLAVAAVPLVSWGFYSAIGSPDIPSQPLQARLDKSPADSSVDELVARAERHLAANPSDGKGWEVLAPIYLRLGRPADAVTAYRNAIRLLGPDAPREAGLGEALAVSQGGVVSDEARQAFERALALEPTIPKASFYLALGLAQSGKTGEATVAWTAMLAGLPPGSPWRRAVEQALAEAKPRLLDEPAQGPTADQVADAETMAPADRQAMIETMVAGLDEKLRANPADRDGWMRLVRSYVVLGRADAASDALERGVAALGTDSADGKALLALAQSLGVRQTETAQ